MATKRKSRSGTKGIVCPNCGGTIKTGIDKETAECPYCGVVHHISDLLEESDIVRAQRIKSDAYREVQQGWQDIEKQRMRRSRSSEGTTTSGARNTKISPVRSKVFSVVIVILAAIASMWMVFTQEVGYTRGTFLIVIQLILLAVAWVLNKDTKSEKKKAIRSGLFIIAVLMIFPIVTRSSGYAPSRYENETIVWSNIVLSDQLPKPPAEKGRIISNNSEELRIRIDGDSKENYTKYVKACRDAGFGTDVVESDYDFDGYNEAGYRLHINHYEYSGKETEIRLTAPIKFSEMSWPDSPIAKLLPNPESKILYREYEYSDSLTIYVGSTSYDAYNNYVSKCIENGFSTDMYRNDRNYHGENSDKYSLTVSYEGNNVMKISIHKRS